MYESTDSFCDSIGKEVTFYFNFDANRKRETIPNCASSCAWRIDFYNSVHTPIKASIYLYTYKTLITLFVCFFVCLFEAVRTNPGYGMAALIYNNLLNLISGTVILLLSS